MDPAPDVADGDAVGDGVPVTAPGGTVITGCDGDAPPEEVEAAPEAVAVGPDEAGVADPDDTDVGDVADGEGLTPVDNPATAGGDAAAAGANPTPAPTSASDTDTAQTARKVIETHPLS